MNRKFIIAGIVAGACLGAAGPAAAQTITVPLQFDHVVLDTPATPNAQIVKPGGQPLVVQAQVDPSNGQFTVQPSGFSMPAYSFTSPAPGTATISLKNPATGTADFANGALIMNADLLATINIQGYGSCTKDTGPITLSTSTTAPLPGQNFPAGANGITTGNGAFGYGWSNLAPGTGPACSLIDGATAGKGGFWVSRGISPVPPALGLGYGKLKPSKRGSTTVVKVTVKGKGNNDANPVKVCLVAANKKALSVKTKCQTVSSLALGQSKTFSFRVKSNKKDLTGKKHGYTVKATASGKGVATVTKSTKLVLK